MKTGRLVIAILTSLLDEALIIFIIIWGLPKLGIDLPLYATVLICSVFIIYAVIVFRAGSRALFKDPVKGFTDLAGLEGHVVTPVNGSTGTVFLSGELWEARSEGEEIEAGSRVTVIIRRGFKLIVRRIKN